MMRAKLLLWGVATAVALSSTAALASVVVVRSLGPSAKAYPPGKTLPESASISLKGGDVVTLLGPSSAQTLRGPGNFEAKQVALASAAGKRGRFGALRTAEVAHNPSIWDLDVTQSGKMCVNKAGKLTLWRPDAETAATVKIRSSDGKTQDLAWAAGKASAVWPASLPLANSAEYQIEWPSTGEKSSVTFVTVASAPSDLVGAAQVLIENGCQNQLDLLVESASKSQ
ncbi:hypothetical protein [Sphingomonas hankyongi]|uniref:Uncharacterized protein n=1 Tax=Sphingomonas hankyongi TaxID=2908209 RepID=A0ABT0RY37_9SPHN|nr:hypothetical protein [Sphingomonas hankyongi]MCL6728508.1 hypothetical protein [Sphingomonas hankyongi]